MRKPIIILFSVFLLAGIPVSDVNAYAAPKNQSQSSGFDIKYPLAGGFVGGIGTVSILVGMSRTKRKATHADHAIDFQNSRITHQEDRHLRTERINKK